MFVVGHRGYPVKFPENTIPSFQAAIRVGAKGVELDVHMTADGQLVVIHDPTLRRTTDGQGEVANHTLSEIKRLEAGVRWGMSGIRVPTLSEVFREVNAELFIVELKQGLSSPYPGIEKKVVETISSCRPAGEVMVNSADPSSLAKVKEIDERISTCLTVDGNIESSLQAAKAAAVDGLHVNFKAATAQGVSLAKSKGLRVGLWTPNKESELLEAISCGPDWITSSYVEKALATLRLRGETAP